MNRLVLASASPRRRRLMAQAGLPCEVIACEVDESVEPGVPPARAVEMVALRKAQHARAHITPPAVIIAADTAVCVDDALWGKPRDEADAFAMLKTLQGRRHVVYTGVAVLATSDSVGLADAAVADAAALTDKQIVFSDAAAVWMRALSDAEIRAYIATGEPMDKAGAYGIQEKGALLVARIEGDYHTVVGLPMPRLGMALADCGLTLADLWGEGRP